MGKAIEALAKQRGHEIVATIGSRNRQELDAFSSHSADAVIEFSSPEIAFENISWCINTGLPVLSGSTGWLDQLPQIHERCQQKQGTFFYASNFSIGVNIFFKLNRYLAKLMNDHGSYATTIEEIHHIHKKDAPSGTAISLADDIIQEIDRYRNWSEIAGSDNLVIKALREGEVPGTHSIIHESAEDRIEIKHEALSRQGFALGAVLVAEWIADKQGILSMDDFLKF